MPDTIWTWLKDGKPKGFVDSEHSLLVSFDMIPLRGLASTRDELNRTGKIACGYLEPANETGLFVPLLHGAAHAPAIDFGCAASTHDRSLRSLCSYLTSDYQIRKDRVLVDLSDSDRKTLREFYWRSFCSDKRRMRPLPRLQHASLEILAQNGFTIAEVRFVETSDNSDHKE